MKKWAEKHSYDLMIAPLMVFLVLMVAFPLIYTVYLSFTNWNMGALAPKWLGLKNYIDVLTDSQFWSDTGHTLYLAFGSVAIELVLGTGIAIVLNRPFAGKNFIKTMLNVAKTHDKLTVVSDQIGTPTYTYDLARLLVDMIETEKYGYYHATNEGGYISWYDFTKEIFRQAVAMGREEYSEDRVSVAPVTTAEYGVSKAKRPFNSRLDKSKLVENGFEPLPTWQDAVARYLKEIEF